MAFDKPQSRNEAILQNILGANNALEPPQSREEYLLQEILNNGGGGGGGGVSVKEITDTSVAGVVEPQEKVTVTLSPSLTSGEKVVGIAYLDILDADGNPLSFVVTDSKILNNGAALSVTLMNALLMTQTLGSVRAGVMASTGSGGGGEVPTVSADPETHTVLISNNKSGESAAEFSFGDVRSQETLPYYMEVETRMYDEESGEDVGRSYYIPTKNVIDRVLTYVINLDDEQNRPTYREVVYAIESGREIRVLSEAYGNMTMVRRYYDSDKVELSAASSERDYPSNLYWFTLTIYADNERSLQKEQLSPESITQLITSRTPEVQIAGDWKYKIGFDGTFEAWYKQTGYRIEITDTTGVLYRSPLTPLALPTELTDAYDCEVTHASVNCGHNNYVTWAELASTNATGINFYALSGGSRISNPNYTLTAYVYGTLTAKA